MGTYYIPRNYRGESRILYIFTVKSLITTAIGALLGSIFMFIFTAINMQTIGIIVMGVFGLIGFVIGAVKIPTIVYIPITKKIGGEPISEIIIRYIKFTRTKKMYTYMNNSKNNTKEEK